MQQRWFFYTGTLSALALIIALLSQHVFSLRPCAWCVFQRVLVLALLVISFIGYITARFVILNRLNRLLTILIAIGGVLAASYQHNVAAKLFSCDMTFADRFMINSGLESALPWLFGIYASCMDATVSILGIDYAIWALLFFVFIACSNIVVLVKKQ